MHSTLGVIPTISEKDAARLLVTETALGELGFSNALRVIGYMKPKRIKAGTTFIREGDKAGTDFMMLLLSGEVRGESKMQGSGESQTLYVVGPGHLLGEVAMFKGGARIASCVASTELAVAVLTRDAFMRLMEDDAQLAAQFLLAMTARVADRLRETTQKLKRFMQLNEVLNKEVFTLMDAQPTAAKRAEKPLSHAYQATEPMPLDGLRAAEAQAIPKKSSRRKTNFGAL
jgi:CRP/FNR family transcriptional regulator, cyclic AMP receptor protein